LLDEESLHFIRIARYVSKIPQITISEDKKVAEQSIIEFFNSFDLFCNSFFNIQAKHEPIPEQMTSTKANVKSRNMNSTISTGFLSTFKTKPGFTGYLDREILAEHLFFYLDLPDLCRTAAFVNKNWHKAYKTHLNARIYLLSEEIKYYENQNIDIVESIRHKRSRYYSDFEIEPPRKYLTNSNEGDGSDEKQKAIKLLSSFTHVEVSNLRRIKNYSKIYELFSAPLVILWDMKPERKATADGRVHISYWKTAFKIISSTQFINKIREFKLESISQKKFEEIERFIINSDFQIEKAEKINKCLASLVKWTKGVYLFHQYLREYSLNYIDHKILTQTEKRFSCLMDNLSYRNFRMLRFVQEHCYAEQKDIQHVIDRLKFQKNAN
jgi:hypothetical protein